MIMMVQNRDMDGQCDSVCWFEARSLVYTVHMKDTDTIGKKP